VLRRVLLSAAIVAALAVPAARATEPTPVCSWPMYGHDPARSFVTPEGCSAVTPLSARTLHLKWVVPTADVITASPTVVDNTVFAGDWAGNFYRFDGTTGEYKTFKVANASSVGFGRIESSAAYTQIGTK
jgi:outer membrane protein assembly factor BamB